MCVEGLSEGRKHSSPETEDAGGVLPSQDKMAQVGLD